MTKPARTGPFRLRIVRRQGPESPSSVEEHAIDRRPGLTLADALEELTRRHTEAPSPATRPLAWGPRCDDQSCGRCTVTVNGAARLACQTTLETVPAKREGITVAPLSKLPLVRDLVVSRARFEADLERTSSSLPGAARVTPEASRPAADAPLVDALARCTGCGACLEACPEYAPDRAFVGPAVLGQLARLVIDPAEPEALRRRRLDAALGKGGLADCGKSQNCVEVCPAGVPVVDAIQRLARLATRRLFGSQDSPVE